MEAQKTRNGKFLILWEVIAVDDDDREKVIALFKDAQKAAMYATGTKGVYGVRMMLYKPEWNPKTND